MEHVENINSKVIEMDFPLPNEVVHFSSYTLDSPLKNMCCQI